MFLLWLIVPFFLFLPSAVDVCMSLYGEPQGTRRLYSGPSNIFIFTAYTPCIYRSTTPMYQPAVCGALLFLFFIPTCSHNQPVIAVQARPVNVVFQIPCDLVAHRLWPLIRARFLSLLYRCPMHNVSQRVEFWTPCDSVAPGLWPMIWAETLFLLCHRPSHNGGSLHRQNVSWIVVASDLYSITSRTLLCQQKRVCNWSTQAALTSA